MSVQNVRQEIWGSADPVEITSRFDATDLTTRLKDFRRDRVVVVITPNQAGEILYDPAAVAAAVGDRAEVAVIRDPDLTFVLTNELPDRFNVFNGAARIYPRGAVWLSDIQLAPIFFATDKDMATRRQPMLIERAVALSYVAPREMMGIRHDEPVAPPAPKRAPMPVALIPSPVEAAPEPEALLLEVTSREADAEAISNAYRTIADRDTVITERDQTITVLLDDLREERDRTTTVSGLLVSSQTEFRAAIQRWQRNDTDVRNLALENGELKKKVATQAKTYKEQLVVARKKTTTVERDADFYDPSLFASPDDALRFAVLQAWVERVPAGGKASSPLPEYVIGDRFIDSFEGFDAPTQSKALKCIVDVLVGGAESLAARQVHPLRRNASAPILTRPSDGAKCYRAYIEENTASARRLHYWKLDSGKIELSRTVIHDDYEA